LALFCRRGYTPKTAITPSNSFERGKEELQDIVFPQAGRPSVILPRFHVHQICE